MASTFVNTPGYVYAVRSHASGLVKIGWTCHYMRRLAELAGRDGGRGEAATLDVFAIVRATPKLERELHEWFAPQRVRGEWFEATEAMLSFFATFPNIAPFAQFVPRFKPGPRPRPVGLTRTA